MQQQAIVDLIVYQKTLKFFGQILSSLPSTYLNGAHSDLKTNTGLAVCIHRHIKSFKCPMRVPAR